MFFPVRIITQTIFRSVLLLLILASQAIVWAEETTKIDEISDTISEEQNSQPADICLPNWILSQQPIPAKNSLTNLSGKELFQPASNQYQLIGDAFVTQPDLVLEADMLFYDQLNAQTEAHGNVQLHQNDLLMRGTEARFNQQSQQGFVTEVQYQFKDSTRAHGIANKIEFDQISEITELDKSTYTVCPQDDVSWLLHFKNLKINNQKRRLYGKHTWLEFKKIPVFYTPYINFPLDDRASGLLFPSFGSHSTAVDENSSKVFAQPYYFNIAPNFDDTLTPIWIEGRGVAIDNEFRYLRPKHRGVLNLTHIDDQRSKHGLKYAERNGEITEDQAIKQRWRAQFNGSQNWGNGFSSNINWFEVSDPDFFNDIPMGLTPSETSRDWRNETQIERSARLNYRNGPVQAHIAHLGYLPMRHGERNILEKSPEIGFNFGKSFGRLYTNFYAETAEFKRYSGFNDFVKDGRIRPISVTESQFEKNNFHQGRRSYLEPSLIYRIDKSYGFIQSQVQGNLRSYNLNNIRENQYEANDTNTVMQYALRGGLVFERDLNLFGNSFIQTLEPEVQYLYVPYVKQDHLKTFDTSLASLDFSNLFALNRFSGYDRIGDTKQVSVAINNRILSEAGKPLAEFGVGQIFYLQDREITLGKDQTQTDDRSDYYLKAGIYLPKVHFASTNTLDKDEVVLTQTQNRLRIEAFDKVELLAVHQGERLNIKDKSTQSIGLGAIIQLNSKLQFASYLNRDITNNEKRQFYNGLRYESCCWALELVHEKRQYTPGHYNESINLNIELKGLSTDSGRFSHRVREELDF